MSGDENRSDAGRDEWEDSTGVARPLVDLGWSGLLDTVGRSGDRLESSVILRPYTGVLGPWQPSTEGSTPRLSFLALPWIIREREVHTTERITTEGVETETVPSTDPTPETSTVYRLLRESDERSRGTRPRPDDSETTGEPRSRVPESDTTPSGAAALREVLAWHPVLVDPSALQGRAGAEPTGRTGSAGPTPVARTLRSVDPRTLPDDGETERAEGTDATAEPTEDRRVGREPRTAVEAADRADPGTGISPVGIARPWLPGGDTPGEIRRRAGIGRSASGFRPRLSTGPTPTVLARLGPGSRAGPVEPLRVDGSPSAGESSNRGTTTDDATAPGSVERPALILPGGPSGPGEVDGRPRPTGGSPARPGPVSEDGNGPLALTYRDAGARDGVARQVTRTLGGRWADPSAPTTAEPVGHNVSVESAEGSTARATATSDPYSRAGVPDAPFASFPDTDAAIDHVYREIERRRRIDRERRGL